MLVSDKIVRLIEEMLEEQNGSVELRRNAVASRIGCVPSQINYVLASRFDRSHGYLVESRRGGGGYIKITRVPVEENTLRMHLLGALGDRLSALDARTDVVSLYENGVIDASAAGLYASLLSDTTLAGVDPHCRDTVRADLFKTILLHL